jgi:DNA invertase Pin-like site-specific DNA recombinase
MRVKYNRVSTLQQSGNRFAVDNDNYDLILLDKVSGTVPFQDRPQAKKLVGLIEEGTVSELICEELSRLGRNTGDVITNLDWLEEKEVNVVVRNLGIQSRPNGQKNPIWKMISAVMSSLYEMELENIKERTMAGRHIYVQGGGKLGRPEGTSENNKQFLDKPKNVEIKKLLDRGLRYSEISRLLDCSSKTIKKVKDLSCMD